MTNKPLEDIFYNVKNPAVFGTAKKLKNQLKIKDKKHLTNKKIIDWISHQDVATLHKQHKQRKNWNHYIVNNIDDLWEMDLCNMVSFSSHNDGYKHILTVIDVMSKFAWARPLKNKSAEEFLKAFRGIINDSKRKPKAVQYDQGTEFKNSTMKKYFYAQNIRQNYPQMRNYRTL